MHLSDEKISAKAAVLELHCLYSDSIQYCINYKYIEIYKIEADFSGPASNTEHFTDDWAFQCPS